MAGSFTNPELRALCEVIAERAETTDAREWHTLAAHFAPMCQWRGHALAELGVRLERAAEGARLERIPWQKTAAAV